MADAAAGRVLIAVAGTHGKSTTSGWLVHALVGAGGDPGAFVGALLPAAVTGIGDPGDGPPRVRRGVRRGGGRVRRQLRPVPARRHRPHLGRVGPPRRVPGRRRGDRGVRGLDPPRLGRAAARATSRWCWSRTRAMPASRRWCAGWATGPGWWCARRWTRSRSTVELAGHIVAAEPDGTLLRVALAGEFEHEVRLTTAGRHNAANALGVIGACLAAGLRARGRAGRRGVVHRRGPPPRAQGRGPRRRRLRRLRPPPHGHPRDPRRRPPAGARSPGLGRLRAADLPPHRGAAGRLRRGAGGRGRRRHRRHLGGRDPDTTIASAAGLAAAVAAAGARQDVGGPGVGRGDGGLARGGRSRAATWSS